MGISSLSAPKQYNPLMNNKKVHAKDAEKNRKRAQSSVLTTLRHSLRLPLRSLRELLELHKRSAFRAGIFLFLLLLISPMFLLADGRRDTMVVVKDKKGEHSVKAQVYDLNAYNRMIFYQPRPFAFVTNVPSDFAGLYKATVKKENLGNLALLLGGTVALVVFDQHITDAVHHFGNYIGLDPARNFSRVELKIGKSAIPVIDLPQNLNSGMYFIGEGWPSIFVASSFLAYGLTTNDYRARQTASQLFEMFFTLAVTVQTIKRITGRESPFQSTQPGGVWHPFTNPAKYQRDVSYYDAMPSGHFATVMATITIIAGNYPTNKWVKPIGYSLLGLLGFAMIHNGVHWAGDYPIAIAIGYTCGKIALARGHRTETRSGVSALWGKNASVMPFTYGNGGVGLSYRCAF